MSDESNSSAEIVDTGNGHLEQHEAPDLPADHESEREAAKKAVREALEAEAKKEKKSAKKPESDDDEPASEKPKAKAKKPEPKDDDEAPESKGGRERGPDGKFVPKAKAKAEDDDGDGEEEEPEKPAPKPKKEEEIDPDTAELKAVLRNRDKIAKAKQAQQQQLQAQQMEFQRQQMEFQRQRQQFEQERQRLEMLRKDPARAIQENGWDPEDFIMSLANEGTPEGKLQRQLREQQMQLQEMHKWREEQLRREQAAYREQQHNQLVQARTNVVAAFTKGAMDESKYPHISSFYAGREHALVAEGDVIAGQYRELTGREATLQEVAEYIEEELAKRAKVWYEKMQKAAKAKTESQDDSDDSDSGKPARGGSRGKSLSNSTASERRALGKDLRDLEGDERLAAARDAVKAALKNAPRVAED